MSKHFKNWLMWTAIAAILSFTLNLVLLFNAPEFIVALSLVETMAWSVLMIPVAINYTRLFDQPHAENHGCNPLI